MNSRCSTHYFGDMRHTGDQLEGKGRKGEGKGKAAQEVSSLQATIMERDHHGCKHPHCTKLGSSTGPHPVSRASTDSEPLPLQRHHKSPDSKREGEVRVAYLNLPDNGSSAEAHKASNLNLNLERELPHARYGDWITALQAAASQVHALYCL